jgi:hypothetical protein
VPYNFYKKYSAKNNLQPIDFSLSLMILLHELYKDFISLKEYNEIQAKIKKNRQLLAEVINYNMVKIAALNLLLFVKLHNLHLLITNRSMNTTNRNSRKTSTYF